MRLQAIVLAVLLAGCSDGFTPWTRTEVDDSGESTDDETGGETDTNGGSHDTDPGEDTGPEGAHTYSCTAIGSSYSDGFFALRGFSGRLYAGQFGYGHEGSSMLYRYSPWELTSPGLTGVSESVCALREFEDRLYANTESSGDIYRSSDGSSWERVHDGGSHTIGCGLEEHGGYLYAVNYDNGDKHHGKILRSADGGSWDTVYDSGSTSLYLREITSHDGTLVALAVNESDSQGWALLSTDGTSWSAYETATRFFRGHSWGGTLWLASTDRSSSGASGVWRWNGGNPTMVHAESRHYVTEITDFDGALFAGTSDGWKDDEGSSALLMSRDGTSWEEVCQFPELAAWSIAVVDEHLYVGTWQYGDGGQVYRVDVTVEDETDEPDDDEPVDCSLIESSSSLREVCETGESFCAGVYADGGGCDAYCAPVDLPCTARYGGEPGCDKEPENVLSCSDDNTHVSDWCECGWG